MKLSKYSYFIFTKMNLFYSLARRLSACKLLRSTSAMRGSSRLWQNFSMSGCQFFAGMRFPSNRWMASVHQEEVLFSLFVSEMLIFPSGTWNQKSRNSYSRYFPERWTGSVVKLIIRVSVCLPDNYRISIESSNRTRVTWLEGSSWTLWLAVSSHCVLLSFLDLHEHRVRFC